MDDFKHQFYKKMVDLRLPENVLTMNGIIKTNEPYPLPIEGCTKDDIETLKQAQQVTVLPEIYIAFLEVVGQSSGDIFRGYDIVFYYLEKLKNFLIEMIEEDKSSRILPPECFVFWGQQGHTFCYFSAIEDPYDPPVYMYSEGGEEFKDDEKVYKYFRDENPQPVSAHLSEFLTQFIAEREGKEAQEAFLQNYVRRK